MKLIVPIKLQTNDLQHDALKDTAKQFNSCCNYLSELVFEAKIRGQYNIHHAFYSKLRTEFPSLSSQIIVKVIMKVATAYANRKVKIEAPRVFRLDGSIAFDQRIISFKMDNQRISIWTTLGRTKINFTSGKKQLALLKKYYTQFECVLIYRKKHFFLHCTLDVPESELLETSNVLGVDLGIRNIAVTSDGTCYSGATVNKLRNRHRKLRAKLQTKKTKSAKRLLRKRSKKERRFARNVNHIISKQIVAKAKCTNSAIALENLKGLRTRTKVRKSQRATLHGWSFYQLQSFIEYKAKLNGVPLEYVNAAYTSTTCPKCGTVDKKNRKDRDHFVCKQCNYADYADYVAAVNIAARYASSVTAAAAVNLPNVSAA